MALHYLVPANQNLKAIRIFHPQSNKSDAALFDSDKNLVLGFSADKPYYPVGGFAAVEEIAGEDGGLVTGSDVWGFACEHLHDEYYRLVRVEKQA